jgi:hypothetical protein
MVSSDITINESRSDSISRWFCRIVRLVVDSNQLESTVQEDLFHAVPDKPGQATGVGPSLLRRVSRVSNAKPT